jgi:hypothetical protein
MEDLDRQIEQLKAQREQTPHHIPVKDLPESERFSRLLTERKHFIDTIKLIAYRAETSMASLLRDKLSRADDARALLRQIYIITEVDLIPALENQTLTVRLHHLTRSAHDVAVRYLCVQLNATATIFPDTRPSRLLNRRFAAAEELIVVGIPANSAIVPRSRDRRDNR